MSPPRDDDQPSPDDGPDSDDPPSDPGDDARRTGPDDDRAKAPDGHDRAGTPGDSPTGSGDSTRTEGDRRADAADAGSPESASGRPVENGGTADDPGEFGRSGRPEPPTAKRADDEGEGSGELWTALYDVASSAAAVLLVGALLFAVSGVWPPMVAIESGSMYPHMQTGDLVFVMDEQRFPGDGAQAGTGVVTADTGETVDYRQFARTGDVIVYEPDGRSADTPIIHRAMFWVEEGENWYERADQAALGNADDCDDLRNCPAPHAGFVTKGDANGRYDQAQGMSSPVKPEWVVGTAEVRVPKLGCVRLRTKGCLGGVGAVNGT